MRFEDRMEPDYENLLEVLRKGWDIEAKWDGLRGFWDVRLTKEGMEARDMRSEERAKLRKLALAQDWCINNWQDCVAPSCDSCPLEQTSELDPECELMMIELGLRR